MPKFRKKPVIIEAFQMTRTRRMLHSEWPIWLCKAWNKDFSEPSSVSSEDYPDSNGEDKLVIHTLEGNHLVSWGDYIIQGVRGELYPCKMDIFEETYEPVEKNR